MESGNIRDPSSINGTHDQYRALLESNQIVRRSNLGASSSERGRRITVWTPVLFSRAAWLAAAAIAVLFMSAARVAVISPVSSGQDEELFSLTNQDRASNGEPALATNGTLHGIGEATPQAICGRVAQGR